MDINACNYNPNASIPGLCYVPQGCDTCDEEGFVINNDSDNDGICDTDEITGCTDALACGYDPQLLIKMVHVLSKNYYNCNGACINDNNNNGICDELEILGCTNGTACNYNSEANIDDGTCNYAELYYDCSGSCINDIDGDGTCDQLENEGCTDNSACNYNPYVTEDDASCESTSCYGCFDANACNYNALAFYPVQNCIYASDISDCASWLR